MDGWTEGRTDGRMDGWMDGKLFQISWKISKFLEAPRKSSKNLRECLASWCYFLQVLHEISLKVSKTTCILYSC